MNWSGNKTGNRLAVYGTRHSESGRGKPEAGTNIWQLELNSNKRLIQMKKLLTLGYIIFLIMEVSGQYVDTRQLSDAGVDIPPQDLLGFGIGNGDLALIKSAIAKGADLNKELQAGSYTMPLVSAITQAANAMLPDEESIITSQIRDFGSEVYSGRTIKELRRDYIEIIRFLLQNGAKPNVSTDYSYGGIPLLRAADYRDIEVISLLLDFKADPNSKDDVGSTALSELGRVAYGFSWPYKNTTWIAKLLISKGAKVTPDLIKITKESIDVFEAPDSPWRNFPFYNELIINLKSLIDFYSKL